MRISAVTARSLLIRVAVALVGATAATLAGPPSSASAEPDQTPVTVYNNLDTAIRFHYESNHCWNVDGWNGDPEVGAGQSLTIDSSVMSDSDPCNLDSNATLTFEPEIQSGSQWINPYASSFSNPYDTSSTWELHTEPESEGSTVDLRDTPGDEAWVPMTAIDSITPDGTGDTGLGMICVHYVDGANGKPGTPLDMYLENEQTCQDASSSSSRSSTRAPSSARGAESSGGVVAIYDLTEMLAGACSLLFPDNSDCSVINDDSNWSFPTGAAAMPLDVENLESETTITPTLELQFVGSQEQDNTGDTAGTISFAQDYTYGTQQASATTQGFEITAGGI